MLRVGIATGGYHAYGRHYKLPDLDVGFVAEDVLELLQKLGRRMRQKGRGCSDFHAEIALVSPQQADQYSFDLETKIQSNNRPWNNYIDMSYVLFVTVTAQTVDHVDFQVLAVLIIVGRLLR